MTLNNYCAHDILFEKIQSMREANLPNERGECSQQGKGISNVPWISYCRLESGLQRVIN